MELLSSMPIARETDPETSHFAAEEVTASGRRATQQHSVLAAVRANPGRTSLELAEVMRSDRYMVARRLPELEAAGLVWKGPARKCVVGNRMAVTWWPAS